MSADNYMPAVRCRGHLQGRGEVAEGRGRGDGIGRGGWVGWAWGSMDKGLAKVMGAPTAGKSLGPFLIPKVYTT